MTFLGRRVAWLRSNHRLGLSDNRAVRAFVITACAWEAAQIACNGPWTWTAGARALRRTKAGRAALGVFCGLLAYHLVIE